MRFLITILTSIMFVSTASALTIPSGHVLGPDGKVHEGASPKQKRILIERGQKDEDDATGVHCNNLYIVTGDMITFVEIKDLIGKGKDSQIEKITDAIEDRAIAEIAQGKIPSIIADNSNDEEIKEIKEIIKEIEVIKEEVIADVIKEATKATENKVEEVVAKSEKAITKAVEQAAPKIEKIVQETLADRIRDHLDSLSDGDFVRDYLIATNSYLARQYDAGGMYNKRFKAAYDQMLGDNGMLSRAKADALANNRLGVE